MKLLRVGLRHLGAWPSKAVGEVEPKYEVATRYYVFMVDLACLLPGLVYLKQNVGKLSFFELGHTYITVLMNCVAFSRLSSTFTKKYQVFVGDFVNRIHLYHFKEKLEYAMETHILVHKVCHFFTYYIYSIMAVGIALFNLIPLYNNFASGAFKSENLGNVSLSHSVYYALPFDYTTDYVGYFCIFCFNLYISYICSSCFCIYDLLLSLIVFHVWGHLRILIKNLVNFEKAIERDCNVGEDEIWYSVETNNQVYLKLRNIIIYHHLIIEYIAMMSQTFGLHLFIYYGFHQACGCLLLLECSQMSTETLLRYLPLTVIIFQQLIQISIIFELIGSMNDKLMDAVYLLPWERMDTRSRKAVHILLRQAQLSLNLKALDMVDVGVRTMIAIIKTSFSYFVMLRTVADES